MENKTAVTIVTTVCGGERWILSKIFQSYKENINLNFVKFFGQPLKTVINCFSLRARSFSFEFIS